MLKRDLINAIEVTRRLLELKPPNSTFSSPALEFAKVFSTHYTLADQIEKVKNLIDDPISMQELDIVQDTLLNNANRIREIVSRLTKREIEIHRIQPGDTLWKVAKIYRANLHELVELNNIKSVFSLAGITALLIPAELVSVDK